MLQSARILSDRKLIVKDANNCVDPCLRTANDAVRRYHQNKSSGSSLSLKYCDHTIKFESANLFGDDLIVTHHPHTKSAETQCSTLPKNEII